MNIIEPNSNFDFSKLSLANPSPIQGGSYFTKIMCEDKPLYIQTPKCSTRQGFLKNGKKISCELMFENTCEVFMQWIENLETKCQQLIYEKSNDWFQNSLEMDDIETAFTPPIKIYKSGKYYLLRGNVKMNSLTNAVLIKIYNENETPVPMEEVTCDSSIISILEIQGIKFTSKNFQIEVEIKQVMVLNKEHIYENCLIRKKPEALEKNSGLKEKQFENLEDLKVLEENKVVEEKKEEQENKVVEEKKEEEENKVVEEENKVVEEENKVVEEENKVVEEEKEEETLLEFVDLANMDSLETMQLKKPNEVYYEIYREAKEKAKVAKKAAITAYLEAKNIKKTYMLNNLDSSSEEESVGTFSDEEI